MRPPTLYLAPLKGFTDHLYRNIFACHFKGFDLAVAPFISSPTGHKIRRKYVRNLLPEKNTGMPVVPQIMSNTADAFVRLANILFDLGYETVNWNLGCPYPAVTKKKRGAGLLPFTDRIEVFLEEVIPAIHGRLSIKTRLGLENKKELFRLIPVLNRYPLPEIIVHPRTGIQRYTGPIDLYTFDKIMEMSVHPVVYNGDITNYRMFKILSRRFNTVDRWMIGRGALANPFLPQTIKSGRATSRNRCKKIKRFHDDLYANYRTALYGPAHLLDRMKGLWGYLHVHLQDGRKLLKKIRKTRHPDQYLKIVDEFFKNAVWAEKKDENMETF